MPCFSVLSLLLTILAIPEISSQECTQSSVVAPEKGRFLFYSNNRKAQLVCQAGYYLENNEYGILHCNQGKWVGMLANCVPNKCRRSALQSPKYWPENGKLEFSPDSGSEALDHLTLATLVCDAEYYQARESPSDKKYYTTFEVESFKCHFGTWVGIRKTKCLPMPVSSSQKDLYEVYNVNNKDFTYIPWSTYKTKTKKTKTASANIKKNGKKFAILDQNSDECPEKILIYRMYRTSTRDHLFADEERKNRIVGKWDWTNEGVWGACVAVQGQCGLTHELHGFYSETLTAHLYRRDVSSLTNWAHDRFVCYIP